MGDKHLLLIVYCTTARFFSGRLLWKASCFSVGAPQSPQNTTAHHSTPLAEKGLFCTNADAKTQGGMNGTTLHRHLLC